MIRTKTGRTLLLALLTVLIPVCATQAQERTETKQKVEIVENGKTYSFEIVEKDGKTLVNGKDISELSSEEREVYDRILARSESGNRFIFRSDGKGEFEQEIEAESEGNNFVVRRRSADGSGGDVNRNVIIRRKGTSENGENVFSFDKNDDSKTLEVEVIDGNLFINGKPADEFEGGTVLRRRSGDDGGESIFEFHSELDEAPPMMLERIMGDGAPGMLRWFSKDAEHEGPEMEYDFDVKVAPESRFMMWRGPGEDRPMHEMIAPFGRFEDLPDGENIFNHYSVTPGESYAMFFGGNGSSDPQVMSLERESRAIARKLKDASESERSALESELERKLNEIFDRKMEVREKSIQKLMDRIETERAAIDERKAARSKIIERRLLELKGGSDPLRW